MLYRSRARGAGGPVSGREHGDFAGNAPSGAISGGRDAFGHRARYGAFFSRRVRGHAGAQTTGSAAGRPAPPLLVIQGSADSTVAPINGPQAARQWATAEGAKPSVPRTVQRGARYAANVTDFKVDSRLVSTLCEIRGLGHAWSGGASGRSFSDPGGPDASRMIWAFVSKQFSL